MSDPMRPGPDAGQVMENMRSPMNKTDMAAMMQQAQEAPIDPTRMTVRELFAKQGIDVDGPVTQLLQKAKQDMSNADPAMKAQAMANAAPVPNPLKGRGPGGPPPGPGGMPEDPMARLMEG